MKHYRHLLVAAWLAALLFSGFGSSSSAAPAANPTAVDVSSAKRPLDLVDALEWRRFRSRAISDDGKWFAYQSVPAEGDGEVVVRSLSGDAEHRFDLGEPPRQRRRFGGPAPARDLVFSEDSRWLAFTVYPDAANKKREGRSSGRPANGNGDSRKLRLIDLSRIPAIELKPAEDEDLTESPDSEANAAERGEGSDDGPNGASLEIDRVRAFAFSGERSRHLAIHRDAPRPASGGGASRGPGGGPGSGGGNRDADRERDERPRGSDLLLRELESGATLTFGKVSEMAFNDSGRFLALAIDTEERSGNALQLHDLEVGTLRVLDSDQARYHSLTFTEEGDALAALKGEKDEAYENEPQVALGFLSLDASPPEKVVVDPTELPGFPGGMTIADARPARWQDDLAVLTFGLVELEESEDADEDESAGEDGESGDVEAAGERDEEQRRPRNNRRRNAGQDEEDLDTADLVIWHWQDRRLQSMQQVQERRDERFSYLAAYRPEGRQFFRIADDDVREFELDPSDRFALGLDRQPYELAGNLEGRRYTDLYATDLETGERRRVAEKVRWQFGTNPQGTELLYYRDGNFRVLDLRTGSSRNLTAGMPVSFIDVEDDHNVIDPPVRPAGWTEDGESVILSDDWDLWLVRSDGSGHRRLTPDGREKEIRYQRVFRLDEEDEGIDLGDDVYVSAYGEWTKRGGLARLEPGSGRADLLFFDDASYGGLMKAEETDVYLYTRETQGEFPDYRLAGADLDPSGVITDANPQLAEIAWESGSRLIDYQSAKGDRLQGALLLPADYEEGKSYPTVVYIYERLSRSLNRFSSPVAYSFNRAHYTSNGYAVLMPDITYQIDDPGMSAVWSVLPALEAAIATGVVDPDRVGLQGHSWGGYQTSFLITQTDAFKAAVAGAPLTNMISMYSSIYWNTGSANQPIFESSQGRFKGSYLDNLEAYARNSPVYHAPNVTTPLMILHNDRDGAVDWNQGIEYFNTLRRLEKPVVMLQYRGENHGLEDPANRRDYFLRMAEFFDHHLKGAPAPEWLAHGIDHLDHEEHLEERAREQEELKKSRSKAGRKVGEES